MKQNITRRRFLSITAFAGLGYSAPLPVLAKIITAHSPYHWKGFTMGTDASIKFYGKDKKSSNKLADSCLKEILKLEQLFSLYEPNSLIRKLNNQGHIENADRDFIELIRSAQNFGKITNGAFDISVQPLWLASENSLDSDLSLINHKNIKIEEGRVWFEKRGMQITLNGIAQGYITDKIIELLKDNGIDNVLVNMGETRALGKHDSDLPWRVGIKNPQQPSQIISELELNNKAIATSGVYSNEKNKIFDPSSGEAADRYASISVISPSATTSDALSTAFYTMPQEEINRTINKLDNVNVIIVSKKGKIISLGA